MLRKDFLIVDNQLKHRKVFLSDINRRVDEGEIETFVGQCEARYFAQLNELLQDMLKDKEKRLLFLAGPSAAGKTTTAKRLKSEIMKRGINCQIVSLDDFLLPHEQRIVLADGSVDYESIYTIDLPLLDKFLDDMIMLGKGEMPLYDFSTNSRLVQTLPKKMGKGDILIIEGLHAINPLVIARHIENAYKVYICPYDDIISGDKMVFSAQQVRMIRRMMRDTQTRNMTIAQSLETWKKVRDGENQNLKPYKLNCDYFFNSSLDYEILLYNTKLKPILLSCESSVQISELIQGFDLCAKLDDDFVPNQSLLWEFLVKRT